MFTQENSEFTADQCAVLNTVLVELLSTAPKIDYADLEKIYSDQLSNRWIEGITVEQLRKRIAR